MKKILVTSALAALALMPASAQKVNKSSGGYPITPVPFTSVKVWNNTFWGQRIETSRKVTIPLAFSKCESEGRYKNFERAAHPSDTYDVGKLMPYSFDDTDPYKTIEGASYVLQTYPDKKLKAYIDSVLDIIAPAQEADGYLYTARTQNPKHPHFWAGDKRWSKEEDLSHELYNLGHMVEGAVAHWQATGSRKFLDIAIRYADCVVREVGPNPGQACVVPGHQIAEMALCKLYLATGNKKYLEEAKFFLDYRGKTSIKQEYSQSHKPVLEQDEAVGHAVRATYMYAGMADVAALTGDTAYIHAIDRIWDNIVSKKLYITGGIGATNNGEAFGKNYELPNMSAYCETCAAIGNVYVNYRLFLLHGESKYYDVLERTLYNGLISGVSMDGGGFFYPNPLESMGQHQRQAWFGCACCPPNLARTVSSVASYAYTENDTTLFVHLYMGGTVEGEKVKASITSEFPWDGHVSVTCESDTKEPYTFAFRIPGWCASYEKEIPKGAEVEEKDGYLYVTKVWAKGETIRLNFPMEIQFLASNPLVREDAGRVAVKRGPVVYCMEEADNGKNLHLTKICVNGAKTAEAVDEMGEHFVRVTAEGRRMKLGDAEKQPLYHLYQKEEEEKTKLKLIPYYMWNNRGEGEMQVWIRACE